MPTNLLQSLGIIAAIIVVDLALSGDNALVIGAVASKLKGTQRRQAITVGGIMAAILRIGLTIVAVQLLKIPYLAALGGVVVFIIAVQLLHEQIIDQDQQNLKRRQLTGNEQLWRASLTILVADATMSLDNVLAIAALARNSIPLLIIGLLLSVALLLLASSLLAAFIERFPVIMYVAAIILTWTAGSMVLNDPKIGKIVHDWDQYVPGPLPDYVVPFFLLILGVFWIAFWANNRKKNRSAPSTPGI